MIFYPMVGRTAQVGPYYPVLTVLRFIPAALLNDIERRCAWLTTEFTTAMLYPLSQKTEVGIRAPRKGRKRPLSNVVFLCPPKTQTALRRCYHVMVGCIEQPLKRLAGSFAGSSNLIQSTAQRLELVVRRFIPLQRNSAMNTQHAQKPKTRISLFNLAKRTP
jgi:hypothetical protein